jgi:hypothetical protein
MLALFVDEKTPFLEVDLPCRFGCKERAALLVHYEPSACLCWPDHLQALCLQHAQRGLENSPGRVVAFITAPATEDRGPGR